MEPAFGWTLLSPEAIRRAEARLREEIQGVRDEIGFLYLHQAYADRFFPGTSVQQTRLRYALFVPWIYLRVAGFDRQKRNRNSIEKLILDEEVRLTGRLLNSKETDGVIGKRVYGQRRPSSQPATLVYWSALAAWGLLRPLHDGSLPSRSAAHRILATETHGPRLRDDDGVPFDEAHIVFANLPTPPEAWSTPSDPITFQLRECEKAFLRRQLLTTRRADGEPSLLARLATDPEKVSATFPWNKQVLAVADQQDRVALERARRAASLAAVGRGVYAYLVEEMRDRRDGLNTSSCHRNNLQSVIDEHRQRALELDMSCLGKDAPGLPGFFTAVLKETQRWLEDARDPMVLLPFYSAAERKRKGNRARLAPTPIGRQRRAEWENEGHPLAQPLHYRWGIVKRMLTDLDSNGRG
jgi:hypothetical protein